ncbi:hypothetical protein QDG88_19160 [Pseudoalteromonas piscicida]|uniref:hypothetical protein n=1 Tax=Pseudoalteromonas piscicida TaxID=43662 RepID=UPI002739A737|nr:hypothetical protein [Pseudoalteromonas piscicida]MDP4490034.1 hypothetical protein [Pseudoalteromonas piscicida]
MTLDLDKYYRHDPISYFYQFGLDTVDIRASILHDFEKYFENHDNLKKNALSDLTNTWLMYLSMERDIPNSSHFVQDVMNIFHEAKQQNNTATFEAFVEWNSEVNQSITRIWSMINHSPNLDSLCNEDFFEFSLSTIGKVIEGVLKNSVRRLAQLNRIRRGKSFESGEFKAKDLGVVIDELINTSNLNNIFILPPQNIRLNQWRNIAYHHNTNIDDETLEVSLNLKGETLKHSFSRKEFYQIVKRVVLTFKTIRIAETIFLFDNLAAIQAAETRLSTQCIDARIEAQQVDFYSRVGSQGFKIEKITTEGGESILSVKDMRIYSSYLHRSIQSSILLYALWEYTGSTKLQLEYLSSSGEPIFDAVIHSEYFQKLKSRINVNDTISHIQFTFRSKKLQNKNPFDSLKLSVGIRKRNKHFKSQLGNSLSLKEFIRQFTLTVFCNYLVLLSEEVEQNKISINVGRAGGITNYDAGITLASPATIEDPNVQRVILKTLKKVIEYFHKSELKVNIVEEAMLENSFYCKKTYVREKLNELTK